MLPLLWGALAVFAGGAVVAGVMITADYLRGEIRKKYPSAFRALILKKKKTAVDVGIYNKQNHRVETIEFQTSEGVSESLRKGQYIYI